MLEVIPLKNKYSSELDTPSMMIHDTETLTNRARMTAAFVERWGMVAAEDGGEDSQGRAKLKLTTTEDVVSRACAMTDLLFNVFEEKGWIHHSPTIAEIKATFDEEEKAEKEKTEA